MMRLSLLAFLISLIFAGSVLAQSKISFNLRPDETVTSSANKSYFSYDAIPAGTVIEDSVVIQNGTKEALHLRLYPADAMTADNGSVAFATGLGETPTGTGRWLTLNETELTLAADEQRSIPFTFAIPANLTGEYVAGIVAQNVEAVETGEGQFGVSLVQRAGVTVLARLPGATEANLGINTLSAQSEGGYQAITANLQNMGNVGVKAEGKLTIQGLDGSLIRELPIQLGYFVPGDSLNYRIGLLPELEAADVDVTLSLTYYDHDLSIEDGQTIQQSARLSLVSPEDLQVIKKDKETAQPTTIAGIPFSWLIAAGVLILFLVVLFIIQSRRLARAQQQLNHQ